MYRKLFNGAKIIFLGTLLTKAMAYVFSWLGAKLGPYEFGIYMLGFSATAFVTANSLLGMDAAVTKYVGHYRAKNEPDKVSAVITSVFKYSFLFSILAAALLFVFAEQAAGLCHCTEAACTCSSKLITVIRIFALSIPFSVAINLLTEVFRAYHNMNYYVFFRDILNRGLRLVLLIPFIFIGFNIYGFAGAIVVSLIAIAILCLYYVRKKIIKFKLIYDSNIDKEIWLFALPRIVSSVFLTLTVYLGTFLIGMYLDPTHVGHYSSAILFATAFIIVSDSIFTPFLPILVELVAKEDYSNLRKYSRKLYFIIAGLYVLPIIFLCFFSSWAMGFLFGAEYSVAGLALLVLSIKSMLDTLNQVPRSMLTAMSLTKIDMWLNIVSGTVLIIASVLLIPWLGIVGAALAGVVSSVILLISSHVIVFSVVGGKQ